MLSRLDELIRWIEQATGLSPHLQQELFLSAVFILVVSVFQRIISSIIIHRVKDLKAAYHLQKVVQYSAVAIIAIGLTRIWLAEFGSMATFLGLLSAGLAIALKDPLVNLAGWLFILIRKPLEVGDRIEIAGHRGDVIDQNLFTFTLMEIGNWVDAEQSTGRIILVPNGMVFLGPVANYFKGFNYIWIEIPVLITFESNWQKAKTILEQIAEEHSLHLSQSAERRVRQAAKKMMIFYNNLTPTVYTSVKDSGVLLTIRSLCEPRQRRGLEQTLWEAVLKAFAEANDIDFAYPSQRIFFNMMEGKLGARAEDLFPVSILEPTPPKTTKASKNNAKGE